MGTFLGSTFIFLVLLPQLARNSHYWVQYSVYVYKYLDIVNVLTLALPLSYELSIRMVEIHPYFNSLAELVVYSVHLPALLLPNVH